MHEAGNEYWLQYDLSPSKSSVVYIDTSTNDGTYIIDGTLKYSTEEKIPRKDFTCDPNANIDSFTQCAFNELQDFECSSAIVKIGKREITFVELHFLDNVIQKTLTTTTMKEVYEQLFCPKFMNISIRRTDIV